MPDTLQIAQIAPITPDPCHLAESFCSLGASSEQLAKLFSVSVETVGGWMAHDADFCAAVHRGRTFADADVAASLHHRAVGYSYTAERVLVGREGPMTVTYTKHLPPHPKAALDWLVNRRPQDWGSAGVKRKLQEWEDARDAAARPPLFFSNAKLAALVDACKEADESPAEPPVADESYPAGIGVCRTVVDRVAAQGVHGWFGAEAESALGARHSSGAIMHCFDKDAPLEWRAPCEDSLLVVSTKAPKGPRGETLLQPQAAGC